VRVRLLRPLFLASALMLLPGSSFAKEAEPDYSYGPPPDWQRFKTLGEEALRTLMPQAASMMVEWPRGYTRWGWKHGTPERVYGYMTCGAISVAGIAASYPDEIHHFLIVIDHDQVKTIDIGGKGKGALVQKACPYMARQGILPPAPQAP
jgi:hypothetical protein